MAHGSLSHFKATLARKQERNQKRQARSDRKANYKSSNSKTKLKEPELSVSELNKVKADIRAKLKSESKKRLIKVFIIMLLLTSLLLSLAFFFG
ncbi:hypothetical protein [Psychroflexus lacisalsi]|jgi:hypothetical protein|uniref:Uncharacterized protein n=1 Tax=Psychroflexus lacisalsi TaxID=503928 RepID=A0ABN1K178_9FLAO|nr:hypothetical protein [Psychroflexus lacisalsi]MBZ9620779.1 hypothetical protein [Psychroflexus lacisalsi]